ncbi:triosephosphate isomerase [Alishewanella longhuensis]|uniref:Triosephosphate isomerase n=1 Tax=Alishewanella longhuensis TaxID=1091037 RepID=A0ABQ3L164_9ALTE|nr:triose-phosphate isomerase [Alishewanella longhuensis]GHG73648.1 triosephosphate isomerase [Alishewanella longhuensis]
MSRKALIAANWKMNGAKALIDSVSGALAKIQVDAEVLICPPATLLPLFPQTATLALGAQDISAEVSGAYTGQLSAALLKEAGASYALVGHSERRQYQFESDELIAAKVKAAIAAGLTPVLCIGESLTERQQEKTQQVIAKQLAAVYASHPKLLLKSVIAYEPIWAIGTGESATPEQAQQTHAFIRNTLASYDKDAAQQVRILYGGSVNAENCAALFTQPDIDGALVGGASLKPEEFAQICLSIKANAKE